MTVLATATLALVLISCASACAGREEYECQAAQYVELPEWNCLIRLSGCATAEARNGNSIIDIWVAQCRGKLPDLVCTFHCNVTPSSDRPESFDVKVGNRICMGPGSIDTILEQAADVCPVRVKVKADTVTP